MLENREAPVERIVSDDRQHYLRSATEVTYEESDDANQHRNGAFENLHLG